MENSKSAVLIPIIRKDGEPHILYEKRALNLSFQPGDICFPGGKIEEGESELAAVVRETCEELLIPPSNIKNVEYFTSMPGPYNKKMVSIFYGEIFNYNNTFSESEVDCVFTIPVKAFPKPSREESGRYPVYYYKDFRIWGFTARTTEEFLKMTAVNGLFPYSSLGI